VPEAPGVGDKKPLAVVSRPAVPISSSVTRVRVFVYANVARLQITMYEQMLYEQMLMHELDALHGFAQNGCCSHRHALFTSKTGVSYALT